MSDAKSNLNAWLAFAAVSFFWGTTYMAIRIGVTSFPPMLMAGFRHTLGGTFICSYFLLRGNKLPDKKALKTFFINGFLMLVLGNGLVTWAEIYVSSGLAALICSLTPIWIVLINSFSGGKERIGKMVILGLALSLVGQFLIFRDNISDFSNPKYALGILFVLVANAAWAYGSIFAKNHKTDTHPLFGAGIQMISGGITLDLIGTFSGEWSQMHPTNESIWALVYLFTFGSIVAYGAYMYVLKHLPATVVSTYAYINTIVAVLLGWLWMDEKLNTVTGIAVLLTLAGVYTINRNFSSK